MPITDENYLIRNRNLSDINAFKHYISTIVNKIAHRKHNPIRVPTKFYFKCVPMINGKWFCKLR